MAKANRKTIKVNIDWDLAKIMSTRNAMIMTLVYQYEMSLYRMEPLTLVEITEISRFIYETEGLLKPND